VPSEKLVSRVRAAARTCAVAVSGQVPGSPADVLRDLAGTCDELGIDAWDMYGEKGAVELLEDDLRERFDVEEAAYFPSGVMAQQVALRVHCDRAGSRRVAMPDLSHLLVHEEDRPRILHDLEISFLTQGFEAPTAAHVEAVPGQLGAVLVELPLRDAGCLLPTWDELTALSSMYVSFYKGLGGLAGAALLGAQDFIAEARIWRRRLGGTLYRTTPEVVSALAGLRDRLPLIPDTVGWAHDFAAALPTEISAQPGVPHTNQFLLYAAGDADDVNERTVAAIDEHRIGLPAWVATSQPRRIQTEIVVAPPALTLDPAAMAALVAGVVLHGSP
jgi:threonine aldolase